MKPIIIFSGPETFPGPKQRYYSRTPIYRAPIYRNPDLPGGFLSPKIFLENFCRLVNLHLQYARSNGDHVSVCFKPSN